MGSEDTKLGKLKEWVQGELEGLQRTSMVEASRGAFNAFQQVMKKIEELEGQPKSEMEMGHE